MAAAFGWQSTDAGPRQCHMSGLLLPLETARPADSSRGTPGTAGVGHPSGVTASRIEVIRSHASGPCNTSSTLSLQHCPFLGSLAPRLFYPSFHPRGLKHGPAGVTGTAWCSRCRRHEVAMAPGQQQRDRLNSTSRGRGREHGCETVQEEHCPVTSHGEGIGSGRVAMGTPAARRHSTRLARKHEHSGHQTPEEHSCLLLLCGPPACSSVSRPHRLVLRC